MPSTTWKMTLTIRADMDAVRTMRDYLRERGIIIPMRHSDVVAKCAHRLIENSIARAGLVAIASLTCPLEPLPPPRHRFEGVCGGLTRPTRLRLLRLAQLACGLL